MVLENFIVDAPIIWDRVGKKIFENPHVKQGRKMRVQITNAGMVEDLSGYTLALGWKHTVSGVDGLDVFEDSSEANVGIFEMAYTENLMTNLGNLKASLVLTSVEDMVVAESNDFYVKVDDSPFGADAEQGVGSFTRLAEILLNEESRIAAEVARVSAEETRITDFNALVDSEIMAQNVATKLQAKEAEYLPRLVSNEQQLAEADTEIVGTNLRIDSLIIPLSPENANLEVTNAHTSVVKGKSFSTLSNRIEEVEGDFKTLVDSELNENHIIRSVPNGVSDYYDSALGVFKKNVGHAVLDGGENFDSFVSTSTNVYKMMITGWVTAENAVRGNVTTFEAVNADSTLDKIAVAIGGGGLLVNTITLSGDALHLYLEKTKVDAMAGATLLDRCKQYLTSKPIDFKYQLVTAVDVYLPNELSANTQWIIKAFGDLTLLSSALISENETWEV